MKKQIVHRLANEFLKFKIVKNIQFWKNNWPKERSRLKHEQNRKKLK
jgi:hypothetical protein